MADEETRASSPLLPPLLPETPRASATMQSTPMITPIAIPPMRRLFAGRWDGSDGDDGLVALSRKVSWSASPFSSSMARFSRKVSSLLLLLMVFDMVLIDGD